MSTATASHISTATASQANLFKSPDPDRIRNQGFLIKVFVKVRALTRNHKRRAFCSNAWLSEELGCSVATVTRALTRLEALGVLALEQVIGIKRYIRVRTSLETLKARLFPGHETHWRESAPEPKPARRRRTAKDSAPPAEAITGAILDHPVEEPAEYPVEEGHSRVSLRDTLQTLPTEEGQQQSVVSSIPSREVAAAPSAELTEPLVEALGTDGALTLAKLAESLKRTPGHVRQCVRAALAKEGIRNLGAYLRRLIEAPEGSVAPPAGTPSHASDRGERPARVFHVPDAPRPEPVITSPARPAPSASAFDALDDATRAELLTAALPRSQAAAKSQPERENIKNLGTSSHWVEITAKKMLSEGWKSSREPQGTLDNHAPQEPVAPQGERYP